LLLAIITGPIGLAVLAINRNWTAIKDGFTAVRDWIGDRITDIVGFFTGLGGRISKAATGFFDGVKKIASDAVAAVGASIGGIVGFFTGIGGKIRTAAGGMFDGIADAFKSSIRGSFRFSMRRSTSSTPNSSTPQTRFHSSTSPTYRRSRSWPAVLTSWDRSTLRSVRHGQSASSTAA
jgi:phage-related protein